MTTAGNSAATHPAPVVRTDRIPRRFTLANVLLLVASLLASTITAILSRDSNHPVTSALVFVIAVLINGSASGLAQGLIAAVYVAVVYSLFVRFPVYLRGLDAIDDVFPVFAITLTAVLSGAISGKLRDRMIAADRARAQLGRLLGYSSQLQRALSFDQIVQALTGAIPSGRTLDSVLQSVRAEPGLPDRDKWDEAVGQAQAGSVGASAQAGSDWPARLPDADERAIASLTVMAIERCGLLEEHASAQAAIQSERLKTALLSSMSHDLRTPISAIAAMAGTLRSYGAGIDEASRAEMLQTILEQCAHLDAFTGKLLSLGRLEAGLASGPFELVDVEEVLGSVLARIRAAFPARQIVRRISPGPWLTMASPVLLEQVLFNVLENALRYSEADTDVTVTLAGEPDTVDIAVADRGCGIAPGDLPHIFERFYRGSSGTGTSGQGLGLAITKAFLDVIAGQVYVTSPVEDGRGTQVRILLPRAVMETAEEPND